jgi:hypothetical protein
VDLLRDFREITLHGSGSSLKSYLTLKKIAKFERELKRVGGELNTGKGAQHKFVESMYPPETEDRQFKYEQMMFRFCAIRLYRGEFSDWTGWEYRGDWAISSYLDQVPIPRWRLEKVRTLAVLGEQGIGDEILFGSVIPQVQALGIKVVIECEDRLASIFQRSFNCETRPRQNLNAERPEDAFIPIGDLPRLFRKTREAFHIPPFLKPLPEKVEKWKLLKGKTGIAWRGRRGQFKPRDLGLTNPVCLQYDSFESETQGMIVPECDLHDDLEDLMGICANLERVVTVPQSIVHLAAPQGVSVDVIVPPVNSGRVSDQINYRYGPGPKMWWYPDVSVFPNLNAYKLNGR